MKKVDYTTIQPSKVQDERLVLAKEEDNKLPLFTKELPKVRSETTTSDGTLVEYSWDKTLDESIKVQSIEFRKGEPFSQFYRLSVKDGEDTILLTQKGVSYVLRKTALAVAKSLYRVYSHVKSVAESIVGYFKTIKGTGYIISKLDEDAWTFDTVLSKNGSVSLLSLERLSHAQKSALLDLIVKKLSFLHAKRLVFGPFSLRNLILTNKRSYFTDLRSLRLSKKASYVVEEFKNTLRYLFSLGIATEENTYPLVATYCVANESTCREWYKEKSNTVADIHTIADELEKEILF